MLENSVWKQYNEENDFREKLAEFCVLEAEDLIQDDKELYSVMKSKLTKKELKFYKLKIQNASVETICEELHCDNERFEEIKKQTILKLNQEKIKKELINL